MILMHCIEFRSPLPWLSVIFGIFQKLRLHRCLVWYNRLEYKHQPSPSLKSFPSFHRLVLEVYTEVQSLQFLDSFQGYACLTFVNAIPFLFHSPEEKKGKIF